MSIRKTIGGDRLGSGKKMTVDLKSYERSTHDLSYIWRSTMASGTLVPFMSEVGLPGDTFDINLDVDIKTHPTVGPLFGSYKIQLDVFQCPIRLYQGQLHNNALGIGMKMSTIKLPQIKIPAPTPDYTKPVDNQQINPSCIFSYLNIRGVGKNTINTNEITREFNAIPYLSYWDIYKNYYANKQEEVGAVIHSLAGSATTVITKIEIFKPSNSSWEEIPTSLIDGPVIQEIGARMKITYSGAKPQRNALMFRLNGQTRSLEDISSYPYLFDDGMTIEATVSQLGGNVWSLWYFARSTDVIEAEPKVKFFPLDNIDEMRNNLLLWTNNIAPYKIDYASIEPYGLPLAAVDNATEILHAKMFSQEGLALKTYQSDLFNNWISTEWIDGDSGINAITAIDTSDGQFTIDTLNLSKKVYDMLNRIAISGGTYDDWLDATYTHDRYKQISSPMYMGGLIRELQFQEVISNAEAETTDGKQPLGTLAGKGVMGNKRKGGNIIVRVDEPCYIMGIISLTPRIDYSQGNKWDVNLKTMDDFHKPALDEIGFQDLITDQMAWWDTAVNPTNGNVTYKTAGKQPAWINYMTNVNQVRGNFAIEDNEMFMTLNRRYEADETEKEIADLTTYIDPVKFNHIFADTARDAQNFWAQIGVDITARRKMSAKIIPNL